MRWILLLFLLPAAALAGEIFTRDGVTDGDAFYLAPAAYANDDAAYQSWVRFSLMRSTCKLQIGGENPARNSSFDCEFEARLALVNAWEEHRAQDQALQDPYLDALADVYAAGFLGEYTNYFFHRKGWQLPEGLQMKAFDHWRREHLERHKPLTRITGSWNYRHKVDAR